MYILWGLFILVTSANLLTQRETDLRLCLIRRYSKALLMPLLASIYISSAADVNVAIVIALALGWIGDLFLMGIRKKDASGAVVISDPKWMFMLGLLSFLLGHLAYVYFFFTIVDWSKIPMLFYGIVCIVGWYGLIILKGVRPKGVMLVGVVLYMVVIGTMIVSALALFYIRLDLAATFIALGAILFGSSDSVLAFRKIRGVDLLPNSYVMFSYISGQFLIILGILN
ncbi:MULTISPECIES: lysoplasmalogenase [unclassified Fusibacter]|uniref:lysoplasmalogenase n=1 Tax=unclassified Fusibacter TaxID=2624464 RepID=UPI001010C178|nr:MULTISPECIES: lysoplasmalogenase [unclassified Fusibacter]MCK8059311.1 lysoplasmalogenase [Fusibacter sp. A2]NPE21225.1 lysoplasmalogenase [Fusibacter sp. A1]RXV62493.1 lysoplasmalogenase [Fusibacter sp. A1]